VPVEPGPVPVTPAPRRPGRHAAEPSGAARLREAAGSAGGASWADDPAEADALPDGDGGRRWAGLAELRWRVPPRVAVVAVLALALLGGAVALRAAAQPSAPAVDVPEPAADAAALWVHVVGRVASPGLVQLPAGSRVAEAIAAAGGALPDADLAAVNLAAVVQDGTQVHVPAPGEAPGEASVAAADPGGSGPATVDVNAASAADLEALPGIGPVLAERVVAWRTEHGPFRDVDGLLDVPGIGPSVLAQIRDLVRV
jgi:competence protein ComEA